MSFLLVRRQRVNPLASASDRILVFFFSLFWRQLRLREESHVQVDYLRGLTRPTKRLPVCFPDMDSPFALRKPPEMTPARPEKLRRWLRDRGYRCRSLSLFQPASEPDLPGPTYVWHSSMQIPRRCTSYVKCPASQPNRYAPHPGRILSNKGQSRLAGPGAANAPFSVTLFGIFAACVPCLPLSMPLYSRRISQWSLVPSGYSRNIGS